MKSAVALEGPYVFGDTTVVAVVKSRLCSRSHKKAEWLFGMKLPIAVIIITDSAKRVFRTDGEEISIQQLREENPGIDIDV